MLEININVQLGRSAKAKKALEYQVPVTLTQATIAKASKRLYKLYNAKKYQALVTKILVAITLVQLVRGSIKIVKGSLKIDIEER